MNCEAKEVTCVCVCVCVTSEACNLIRKESFNCYSKNPKRFWAYTPWKKGRWADRIVGQESITGGTLGWSTPDMLSKKTFLAALQQFAKIKSFSALNTTVKTVPSHYLHLWHLVCGNEDVKWLHLWINVFHECNAEIKSSDFNSAIPGLEHWLPHLPCDLEPNLSLSPLSCEVETVTSFTGKLQGLSETMHANHQAQWQAPRY